MKIVVMNATTLIGRKIIHLLEKKDFPITDLMAVEDSKTKENLIFKGRELIINTPEKALDFRPHFAFFTGNIETAIKWAKKFAEQSTYVIDNSPVFRAHENIKLIIPEINASVLNADDRIIASPNCTSIQMVMPLAQLHKKYKIKRIVVTTFQAVSGAGEEGINQLITEEKELSATKVFAHSIYNNTIPHVDEFNVNAYTQDEIRLMSEIKKLLNDDKIQVSATCTRVPVQIGHSESLNIEFENDFVLNKVKQLIDNVNGVSVYDDPLENKYPMPSLVSDSDEVLVGRIRRDYSKANSLNLWISANNILRGAASNSINIMEYVYQNFLK